MELLAPAGGWEQLEYAVHFGADAVYLASQRYGMRRRADNFSEDDLPRVVEYAHAHGVDVPSSWAIWGRLPSRVRLRRMWPSICRRRRRA